MIKRDAEILAALKYSQNPEAVILASMKRIETDILNRVITHEKPMDIATIAQGLVDIFIARHEFADSLNAINQRISDIQLMPGPEGKPGLSVQGRDGTNGLNGRDADESKIISAVLTKIKLPDQKQIIKAVLAQIPIPKDGVDGKSVSKNEIVKEVMDMIQLPQDGKDAVLDYEQLAAEIVKKMPPKLVTIMSKRQTQTSSTGSSYQSPSGSVDGVNTTFVFTTAPSIIIVDGIPRQKTASDGTVNWTGTTTVVLTIAPTFDIFGL